MDAEQELCNHLIYQIRGAKEGGAIFLAPPGIFLPPLQIDKYRVKPPFKNYIYFDIERKYTYDIADKKTVDISYWHKSMICRFYQAVF